MDTFPASFFSILANPILSSWTVSAVSETMALSTRPFWTVPSGMRSSASTESLPTH